MANNIRYEINTASEKEIYSHLVKCDGDFVPSLSKTVNIEKYSKKLFAKAIRFEAWSGKVLVGCVAAYINDKINHLAYITNVSVIREYMGQGIASGLLLRCIEYVKENKFCKILLEVNKHNSLAISLYKKFNFRQYDTEDDSLKMMVTLDNI
ncbi:MAG: GNAT family N-acetyltransferase [Candidatus Shapirobacteria bacterium]|jgi:ribosomal protein S18 acetylase RimI-like enzyme